MLRDPGSPTKASMGEHSATHIRKSGLVPSLRPGPFGGPTAQEEGQAAGKVDDRTCFRLCLPSLGEQARRLPCW